MEEVDNITAKIMGVSRLVNIVHGQYLIAPRFEKVRSQSFEHYLIEPSLRCNIDRTVPGVMGESVELPSLAPGLRGHSEN